jgi:hypothetical protein
MKEVPKLIAVGLVCVGSLSCVQMTPAEACTAICSKMEQCQVTISGSSLTPGPSCATDCVSLLAARGASCKSSAAYLGDCFNTYSCSGIDVGCSENANSFSSDCS